MIWKLNDQKSPGKKELIINIELALTQLDEMRKLEGRKI